MTSKRYRDDEDSRSSLPLKRSRSTSGNSKLTGKKRRRNPDNQPRNQLNDAGDSNFEVLSQFTEHGLGMDASSAESRDGGFGRNRLMTGFTKPPTLPENNHSASTSVSIPGHSPDSAIEITDEDMEDSEGGMVINIDDSDPGSLNSPPLQDAVPAQVGNVGASERAEKSLAGNSSSTKPPKHKKLVDLSPDQLEDQIKYAFFHLDRDQIDLNRPVMCLACAAEGHIQTECSTSSTSLGAGRPYFPIQTVKPDKKVKLWISCCVCASKSHLVGDCSRADAQAARWSLKSLTSSQITNLSLETGTGRLEKEAESRGMRPVGLQIKGRAGRHQAGASQAEPDTTDEEPFLHSRRRQPDPPRYRPGPDQPRYDRFDAPSDDRSYRPRGGPGNWYGTDSFGRKRSKSPAFSADSRSDRDRDREKGRYESDDDRFGGGGDSWRPGEPTGRPPPGDSYRPLPARPPSPNRSGRAPTAVRHQPPPRPNIQIQLPTRKGSNTWQAINQPGGSNANSNTSTSQGTHNNRNGNAAARSSNKNRAKNRKKAKNNNAGLI